MKYIVEISYVYSLKYAGWQIQKNKLTYQQEIERVFSNVLKQNITVVASGRTDSGVSALKQVVHFEFDGELPKSFVGHVNNLLSEEISVLSVKTCNNDFHARFDAKSKTYKYFFYVNNVNIPFYDKFATQIKGNIDENILLKEVKSLVGTHDFTSFCASGNSVNDFTRTIYYANLEKVGNLWVFTVTGNGFLYNMVRIIMGTLIELAQGKLKYNMKEIINQKDRKFAGKTAPAKGLVLFNVEY